MAVLAPPDLFLGYEDEIIHKHEVFNTFRQTSFITTFSEQSLTYIDIQNFIEAGLRIIRFKMTLRRKEENLKILTMLKDAIKSCCEKYEISSWPIAVSIDIPNACIRTGLLDDFDVIIINCIRYKSTIEKVKKYFLKANCRTPVIVATICDQLGLDNFDEIIQEADAIVLAREFLAQEIDNKHLMVAIQMQICAKCRSLGIPIYISGSILENVLQDGQATGSEISDITNIVLQGGGLFLRSYRDPNYVLRAMHLLNSICKSTETVAKSDFWDLVFTPRVPVNAAEAATLGCAILARQTLSKIIIVLTVTGKSAVLVSRWCPEALIITVSADEFSARKLLLYRGIMPLIYKEKPQKNWYDEMNARIDYATEYAVKHDILKYGQNYVVLRKSSPTTSYADSASARKVFIGENKRQSIVCEDTTDAKHDIEESLFSFKTLSRVLN